MDIIAACVDYLIQEYELSRETAEQLTAIFFGYTSAALMREANEVNNITQAEVLIPIIEHVADMIVQTEGYEEFDFDEAGLTDDLVSIIKENGFTGATWPTDDDDIEEYIKVDLLGIDGQLLSLADLDSEFSGIMADLGSVQFMDLDYSSVSIDDTETEKTITATGEYSGEGHTIEFTATLTLVRVATSIGFAAPTLIISDGHLQDNSD